MDEPRQQTLVAIAPLWMKIFIWLLVVMTLGSGAVAGGALKQVSDLRADLTDARRETYIALVSLAVGPEDVQRWINTGDVRLPAIRTEDIRPPLGCFAGDFAVWTFFGLSC